MTTTDDPQDTRTSDESGPANEPVDVTCPVCSTIRQIVPGRFSSFDFCDGQDGTCDFPLFWATAFDGLTPSGDSTTSTRLRLPGVKGIDSDVFLECPNDLCRERNARPTQQQRTSGPIPVCWRCKTALFEIPVSPEPAEEPVEFDEPVAEEPAETPRPWWWPWGVVAGIGAIEIALLVLALVVAL